MRRALTAGHTVRPAPRPRAGVRRRTLLAAAVVLGVAGVTTWQVVEHASGPGRAHAGASFARAVSPSATLAAINAVRVSNHRRPLRLSRPLSRAATQHAREMGRLGYFAHHSANGTPFWKRIRRYYHVRGFSTWTVGENLVWRESLLAPSELISDWMASPEHRANLLARRWREIGIGSAQVPHAPGFYSGLDVAIVTADFGRRTR